MSTMLCRDCKKDLKIPIEYSKLSGKPKKAKRCDDCRKKFHRKYTIKYKKQDADKEKIISPRACTKALEIVNRIENQIEYGFTRDDIPTTHYYDPYEIRSINVM